MTTECLLSAKNWVVPRILFVPEVFSGAFIFMEVKMDEKITRLKEELKAGVQTIQYQINTLMTTNG